MVRAYARAVTERTVSFKALLCLRSLRLGAPQFFVKTLRDEDFEKRLVRDVSLVGEALQLCQHHGWESERDRTSVKRSVKRVMTRSRGDFQLTLGLTPEVGKRKSFFCSAASRQSPLSWASTGSRNIG